MANPSVTYTFTNTTTADGTEVNTNFQDLISSLTDGSKDITINQLTLSGSTASRALTLNGSKVLTAATTTATEVGYLSGINDALSKLPRPNFYVSAADQTQLVVPASSSKKAVVRINGAYYINTSNATCDLDTAGRGGLDTGSKAASTVYYFYAVPPTSGTTFDLVCSATDPGTGPSGFANWSYLGAWLTDGSSNLYVGNKTGTSFCFVQSHTISSGFTSTSDTAVTLPIPVGSGQPYIGVRKNTGTTTGSQRQIYIKDASSGNAIWNVGVFCDNTNDRDADEYTVVSLKAIGTLTVYWAWRAAPPTGWSADFLLKGWIEDPTEYV